MHFADDTRDRKRENILMEIILWTAEMSKKEMRNTTFPKGVHNSSESEAPGWY